jgi:hypothetical protein
MNARRSSFQGGVAQVSRHHRSRRQALSSREFAAVHESLSWHKTLGTKRTWPDVRLESASGGRAEVEFRGRQVRC